MLQLLSECSSSSPPSETSTKLKSRLALVSSLPSPTRLSSLWRSLAGTFDKGLAPAHDPEHKVLGIVGMGGIGRVGLRFHLKRSPS